MENKPEYKIQGREPTIFRVIKRQDNPYVMIDRRPIDNSKLSFKAKGILTYLMSRPDGWEVNVPDLVNHGTDGAAAIRSGLHELRDAGHLHYNPLREGGYIKKWVIEVFEVPDLRLVASKDDESGLVANVLDDDFLQVENLQVENRGEVLSTLSINELKQDNTGKAGKKKIPEGLPEPTGDVVGDWLKATQVIADKNKPFVAATDSLSSLFRYNFPRYGEDHRFDSIVKMIVKDGRSIKQFVEWAKRNKRDPHWYHVKPTALWGDWPQAFPTAEESNPIRIALKQAREEMEHGRAQGD